MAALKRIGVFTSGGDAPGMNACIRAVVRTALVHDTSVYGILRGYQGLVEGESKPMTSRSVSNIIQLGGTILKTARSKDFMTDQGMEAAYRHYKEKQLDGMVAIGGDGTFKGALAFMEKYPDVRIVGIPGTIDNDLAGTDFTLGFDTALNTVIGAVDKIRDTAASHNRCFLIEVMGRDSGCIALWAGVAGGAEEILLPEIPTDLEGLVKSLEDGKNKNKTSSIFLVAEGEKNGGANELAAALKARVPHYEPKVTVLGHVQRGGSPSANDRILGAKMGVWAVEALVQGESGIMIGVRAGAPTRIPFREATRQENPLDNELFRINRILAT